MIRDAEAEQVIAEIQAISRRNKEIAAPSAGRVQQEPALTGDGEPSDSGRELDSPGSITEAALGLVSEVSLIRSFRQITFAETNRVRIRMDLLENGDPEQAHLEIFRVGRWESQEMNSWDTEAIGWLMEKFLQEDEE